MFSASLLFAASSVARIPNGLHGMIEASNEASADGSEVGECRYEEVAPATAPVSGTPPAKFSREGTPRDPQCLVSAEAAIRQWRDHERLVIDVRPSVQWSAIHITGSLNIQPGELRTKRFLKAMPIALLDKGENQYAMEELCFKLKTDGFKDVKIVAGGLSAWHWHGGPIANPVAAASGLYKISAQEFMEARQGNTWVLVGLGIDVESQREAFGENIHVLQLEGRIDPIVTAVRAERARRRPEDSVAVLFVSNDGRYDFDIEGMDKLHSLAGVYFLERGLDGQLEYMRTVKTMLARASQPKIVKRCGR